jgi:hypothetical protein
MTEVEKLRRALDASVILQAHYAALLNAYDGGERLIFTTTEEWLKRVDEVCAE